MKHLSLIFLVFFSLSVFAGNDNVPVGARSAGLANSSVTLSDVWSVHQNQAGLGFMRDAAAGVYYESRFMMPELGLSAFSLVVPIKVGAFGLSVRNFGFKSYNESKIGLAYGRAFGENLSIGIQLDYQNVRFADAYYGQRSIFTAEIGAIYKLSKAVTIAAHLYNPTQSKLTDYNGDRLPSVMRFGLRYQFSKRVFLASEAEKDLYNPVRLRAGIEYQAIDILYLRAGVSGSPLNTCFGFGLKLKKLMIDFAGTFHQVLGFTPQFSLNYQFGEKSE